MQFRATATPRCVTPSAQHGSAIRVHHTRRNVVRGLPVHVGPYGLVRAFAHSLARKTLSCVACASLWAPWRSLRFALPRM